MLSNYFLSPEVYFCSFRDDLVFLDLQKDDYTLINGPQAQAVRALVSPKRASDCIEQPLLGELLQGGLLTTDPSIGRALAPTTTDVATDPLVDYEDLARVRPSITLFMNFLASCGSAAIKLRFCPLVRVVRGVQRRKLRHANHFDLEKARALTGVFHRLRSLFPRNYLCLYDSLALLEFLARYRIFPSWVFGVMLEPWAAHCWVQEKQFILNEDIEEAAAYTPVMVI